jgi:hypothetical protein
MCAELCEVEFILCCLVVFLTVTVSLCWRVYVIALKIVMFTFYKKRGTL